MIGTIAPPIPARRQVMGRSGKKVLSQAKKELGRVLGDTNVLLVLVLAPLLYSLIFGLTYLNGKVYDLPIAVVDYDGSELSRTIIRSLESNESLTVHVILNDDSRLRDLMVREECWGAVVIPPDMERTIKRGGQAQVRMVVNTSNIIIGNYAQRGMQTALGSVGAAISMSTMEKKGTPQYAVYTAFAPVDLQTRVLFNPASNYALFVVPLLIMLLIHQVVALASGMSWAKSLSAGETIARQDLHAAIIGRALPYAAAALFWIAISLLGTHTLMGIPYTGSIVVSVLFMLLVAATVALFGSLAGVLVKDKLGVVQMLFFTSMPLLLLSGGSWPLESMPAELRWLALMIPATHIMSGYRRLALEDPSFVTMLPVLGALALAMIALYSLLAVVLQRHQTNTAIS
jgi:ABC-2 type transport system permease protein